MEECIKDQACERGFEADVSMDEFDIYIR